MEGLYYYTDEKQEHLQLLRFYFDGLVIGAALQATLDDLPQILDWFNREQYLKSPHRNYGQYNVSKNQFIHFVLESSFGKVIYTGELKTENRIALISHSHINGHVAQVVYSPIELPLKTD